jgi:sortase A
MNTRSREPRFATVLHETGRTFIALGILVLLFAGYQNWITDTTQHRSQTALQQEVTKVITGKPVTSVVGTNTPLPTSKDPGVGHWLGVISIPTISLSQVIVDGTDKSQLQLGPGHYLGTAMPGEVGNVAIAGHRTTWGRPFRNLDKLHKGDQIFITTPRAAIMYRVVWIKVVSPSDTGVVAPTTTPSLTLTTCNPPYSAASRLIVRAELAAVGKIHTDIPTWTVTERQSSSLLKGQGHNHEWPVLLYGLLLALILIVGERHRRQTSRLGLTIVATLILAVPVTLLWFNAIAHVLPAGI